MSLSKKQKDFLKTIKDKKTRKHQKQQFKLQNKFDKNLIDIVFVDGEFKTDNPNMIYFFEQAYFVTKKDNAEKYVWHEHNIGESFEKMKNSLTEETLRDLTEPKEESLSDFLEKCERSLLQNLDHGTCMDMYKNCVRRQQYVLASQFKLKQIEILSKFDDEKLNSFLQQGFIDMQTLVKAKTLRSQNIVKTDNQDIPKEFCVEITEENRDVLASLSLYAKTTFNSIKKFDIGNFFISNTLFGFLIINDETYLDLLGIGRKEIPIVSINDFFKYINKEDFLLSFNNDFKSFKLIKEYPNSPKINTIHISTHRLYRGDEYYVEYPEFWKELDSAKTKEPKPLEFDLPKKENPIQDIECLSINDIIYSGVLILESPLCQNLKNHLIDIVEKKTNPLNL